MEYMVLSMFQVDPQSSPIWEKHFVGSYKDCVNYTKEKAANPNNWAKWLVYPEGEYPIGYLKTHNIPINNGPVFQI